MIETALLQHWAARLRAENPDIVAILTHGSYARGEQQRHSDLDLDVLTEQQPAISYRSMIETQPNGDLLHATIAYFSLARWLEQFEQPQESQEWAFYLAARQAGLLLWAAPTIAERLIGHTTVEMAAAPQLQDLIEGACKVRNTYAVRDELGARLAAADMAIRCPAVVGLLNPPVVVRTRTEALRVALAMPHVPAHYSEDLLACLGLSGHALALEELYQRAMRLARGIVSFLEPHASQIAPSLEPDLALYLADGRLMRLLTD